MQILTDIKASHKHLSTVLWIAFAFAFIFHHGLMRAQSLKFKSADTAEINSNLRLGNISLGNGDLKTSKIYALKAKHKAMKAGYTAGIGRAFILESISLCREGYYQEAIRPGDSALLIAKKSLDSVLLSMAYKNEGNIQVYMGNTVKGLDFYFKGLAVEEKLPVQENLHWYYNNIGNVYHEQLDYRKAIEFTSKAIHVCERRKDKHSLSLLYSNIGNIYLSMGNNDTALYYLNLSLRNSEEVGAKFDIANVLSHIASVTMNLHQYDKAREIALRSLQLSKEYGYQDIQIVALTDLGEISIPLKQYDAAEKYFLEALHIAEKIDSKALMRYCYDFLSTIYKEQKDFKKAYDYYKLYSDEKDSILNAENSKLITEMNAKYASEKKEKEIELLTKVKDIQNLELAKKKNELEKQRLVSISVSIGFVLLVIVAILTYSRYRLKKKANDQLQTAYNLITEKNAVIEKSNLMITDSIQYAKRIQDAILPSEEELKERLSKRMFILFHPLQIVSGDFYWCSVHEDKVILVIADCTGHGVPGAFMSLIANTLLNEIVNEQRVTCTKEIASLLDKKIIHALRQEAGSQKHDGMDISICCMNKKNRQITFTGARHFMYIYHKQLHKIKGDPFSVGGAQQFGAKQFTSQTISYEAGARIYFLTDGYCDQSGGKANKRFSSKKLEQLLTEIQIMEMEDQKKKLEDEFFSWKGITQQRDDVLIVGIQC